MSNRLPEPQTETEAQARRGFLRQGAHTEIRVIERIPGSAGALIAVGAPQTFRFQTTAESLAKALALNAERRVALTLELVEAKAAAEMSIALFLNKEQVSTTFSEKDQAYIGTIGFFELAPDHQADNAVRKVEWNITRAVRSLPSSSASVTITAVLVPTVDKPSAPSVRISSAQLAVTESTVKR